jgi:hypothetical protein
MKRIIVLALCATMAFAAVAAAQSGTPSGEKPKAEKAAPVTLTGEILDMYCYMDHKATGPDHAKCATSCIKKGLPIGFLTADGTVYLVIGKDHEPANAMVADFAGKQSTITGKIVEQGGMKAIEIASIADAK